MRVMDSNSVSAVGCRMMDSRVSWYQPMIQLCVSLAQNTSSVAKET